MSEWQIIKANRLLSALLRIKNNSFGLAKFCLILKTSDLQKKNRIYHEADLFLEKTIGFAARTIVNAAKQIVNAENPIVFR
jgi:hypothetical protein